MNNTTSPISTLDTLKSEYEKKSDAARRYASANFIFDFYDADETYLRLLIEREEAHYDYKRAEVNDDTYFNHRFAPVINHRIQTFKKRLSTIRRTSS
ncbi:MAG: hypothetical protein IJ743_04530 [Bacilli bacterium]|nr:hypothetical protein [Bacilli bacterium]